MRTLLAEVLDAARPSINKAGLDAAGQICPRIVPPVLVDRQLIHQAVLNLLLNACEFTDPAEESSSALGAAANSP